MKFNIIIFEILSSNIYYALSSFYVLMRVVLPSASPVRMILLDHRSSAIQARARRWPEGNCFKRYPLIEDSRA